MRHRKVIEVHGLGHGTNPIPVGVVIAGMLYTGTVPGIDRETGKVPADRATEMELAFVNMEAVLEAAGASWASIARVDVLLRDKGDRPMVNDSWVKRFPDPQDRPVRHVTETALPYDYNIQIEVIAVVERA